MMADSLTTSDIAPLSGLLTRAFADDPGLRFVIPDDAEWTRIAPRYFAGVLSDALRQGHNLVDENRRGIALWEPPGFNPSFPRQLATFARLAFVFRHNFARALQLQRQTEQYRPRTPFWYLAYIATEPGAQGNGIGSELLTPVLELAERENLPVFLECANPKSLDFYLGHGFSIVDEVSITDGPDIWPLRRDPR